MSKPILCVDFDGVIHSYTSGWKGADVVSDPPVPHALRWLKEASQLWDIHIYSSRSSQSGGVQAMMDWLHLFSAHEFGSLDAADMFISLFSFPTQKPAAFLTIDDRAVCFQGNWEDLDMVELLNFKPWNKK